MKTTRYFLLFCLGLSVQTAAVADSCSDDDKMVRDDAFNQLCSTFKNSVHTGAPPQRPSVDGFEPEDSSAGAFEYYTIQADEDGDQYITETESFDLFSGNRYYYYRLADKDDGEDASEFRFKRAFENYYYIASRDNDDYLSLIFSDGQFLENGETWMVSREEQPTSSEILSSLWRIEKIDDDNNIYTLQNAETGKYLVAADIDGSRYDVHVEGTYNNAPQEARWRIEPSVPGRVKLSDASKLELYNVKLGEVNLTEADIISQTETSVRNETQGDGTIVTRARNSFSDTKELTTTKEISQSVLESNTVSASVTFSGGVDFAKRSITVGTAFTHERSTSSTEATSNTVANTVSHSLEGEVRHNYGANAHIAALTTVKRTVANVPYSATAVKTYDDGYYEVIENYNGTIEAVSFNDFQFTVIDLNASVAKPERLDLSDALSKNQWASGEQINNWGLEKKRSVLINALARHSSEMPQALNVGDSTLIKNAMIHYWAVRSAVIGESEAVFYNTQQKLDKLIKLAALHSSVSLKELKHKSVNNVYAFLTQIRDLSMQDLPLRQFLLNDAIVDLADVLAYLNWSTVGELATLSDAQVKAKMVALLLQTSQSDQAQLSAKDNDALIAHALMYQSILTRKRINGSPLRAAQTQLSAMTLAQQRDEFLQLIQYDSDFTQPYGSNYQLMTSQFLRGFDLDANSRAQINDSYGIISKHSGKALDVAGWSKDAGANVIQFHWFGNHANQLWRLLVNDEGYISFQSVHSGKNLDLNGSQTHINGGNIIQWHPLSWSENQKWKLEYVDDRYFKIKSLASQKCVDVGGWSEDNGGNIIQWDCFEQNANQLFELVPAQ